MGEANAPRGALAGRLVVITRPAGEAAALRQPLEAAGATVLCVDCLRTVALPLDAQLRHALRQAPKAQWAAFASWRAVGHLAAALRQLSIAWPMHWQLAAVGQATAAALRDVMPTAGTVHVAAPQNAEGLLALLLRRATAPDDAIFLPMGRLGRRHLLQGLQRRGHPVQPCILYDTQSVAAAQRLSIPSTAPLVLCTSPSALRGLCRQATLPPAARLICIGPSTSAACRAAGYAVHRQASPHSLDGLLQAALADRLP